MQWKLFIVNIIIVVTLCLNINIIFGQETNWGKWGAEDEIGTLNYVTPEVVRYAVSLVKQGKVFNLGLPIDPTSPCGTGRIGRIYRYMISTSQGAGMKPGLAEDHLFTPLHGNSHWDGIAHFQAKGKMYNGYDAEKYVTPQGALKNGIHNVANKVVTRGVLLDVARYKGMRILNGDCLILPEDLEGASKKQGVSFRQGDVILIRTGWQLVWYEQGKEAYWRSGSPGIGWRVTQWLKNIKAVAVSVDAQNVEFQPPDPEAQKGIGLLDWDYPVHVELCRNQGMMVGDCFYMEDLAEDCAKDGIYEFLFVGPPLNIISGTGSIVNPQAIK